MESAWAQRASENLLPLSRNQRSLKEAIQEWRYTDTAYDLGRATADCELCDHPNIRYQFEIWNKYTGNTLLIGSECITKFEIPVQDEQGNTLDAKSSKRKVAQDRQKLIKEGRKQQMINVLLRLAKLDQDFQIESFINYVQERGAFTPSQLSTLAWRLEKYAIQHQKSDFKLIIKRDREKQQLIEMEEWKLRKLWPYMSISQQEFYRRASLHGP